MLNKMNLFCCSIALAFLVFAQGQKDSNGTFSERRKRNTETAWRSTGECPEFPALEVGETRDSCRHVETKNRTVGDITLTCYVAIGNKNKKLLSTYGFAKPAEQFVDSLLKKSDKKKDYLKVQIKVQEAISATPNEGNKQPTIFPPNHPDGRFRLDRQREEEVGPASGSFESERKFANLQIQLNACNANKGLITSSITSIAKVHVQFADVYDNPISGMKIMYGDKSWAPVIDDVAKALKMSMKDQATAYVWYIQNNAPTPAGKNCGNRRNARSGQEEYGESCPIDFSNRGFGGDLSKPSLRASQEDNGGRNGAKGSGPKKPTKKRPNDVIHQNAGGPRKNGRVGRGRKKSNKNGQPTNKGRRNNAGDVRPDKKDSKTGRPRADRPKKMGDGEPRKMGRNNNAGVGRPSKKDNRMTKGGEGMKTKNDNRRRTKNRQGSVKPRPKKQPTFPLEEENGQENGSSGMTQW